MWLVIKNGEEPDKRPLERWKTWVYWLRPQLKLLQTFIYYLCKASLSYRGTQSFISDRWPTMVDAISSQSGPPVARVLAAV